MMGLSVYIKVFAESVLNTIPEGLLIAGLAWLLLRMLGRQNSGTRFAVWFTALLAIALIPFMPATNIGGSVTRAVHAELTVPTSWAVVVIGLWCFVAMFAIARLGFGLRRLRMLKRNSVQIPEVELDPLLVETMNECRVRREVELRVSFEVRVPTAIGFFHPIIIIPDWALTELSAEELRAVVLHEFAHLRRRDDWTNLAQKLVRAVFFFHPAVLWVEKRLSLEREMACDDAVLAETRNPHAYARCLVSVAEKSLVRRSLALAQAAIGRAQETSLRVAQILDVERPSSTRIVKPILAAVGGVLAVSFLAVPDVPRLIAFQDPTAIASSSVAGSTQLASMEQSPRVPSSMVVPAMLHMDRMPKVVNTKAAKRVEVSPARPKAVLAKHVQSPRRPLVVQAGLKQSQPQQFLVVTQTTDYYRQGSAIVGISVWRVTLVNAQVTQTIQAAKQT